MQRRLASNTPSCPPLIQFIVWGSSITHIQKLETSDCWQSTNENRSPLDTQAAPRCPLLEVCGVSKAQAPLRVGREGRKQSDAAISAASHLCTLLGASTAAPCWTKASGGSPPLSVAATVRRTREESAISTGKQVTLMTVGSGFAAPFFIVRHQLLKKN